MSELKIKREFRKLVGIWSEAYETRSGSGLGYPDLQLLVHSVLVPVELKLGRMDDGWIKPKEIRPSQISWHHSFMTAGGIAYIAVGWFDSGRLQLYALPRIDREGLAQWKRGWHRIDCWCWVSNGELLLVPSDLLSFHPLVLKD